MFYVQIHVILKQMNIFNFEILHELYTILCTIYTILLKQHIYTECTLLIVNPS